MINVDFDEDSYPTLALQREGLIFICGARWTFVIDMTTGEHRVSNIDYPLSIMWPHRPMVEKKASNIFRIACATSESLGGGYGDLTFINYIRDSGVFESENSDVGNWSELTGRYGVGYLLMMPVKGTHTKHNLTNISIGVGYSETHLYACIYYVRNKNGVNKVKTYTTELMSLDDAVSHIVRAREKQVVQVVALSQPLGGVFLILDRDEKTWHLFLRTFEKPFIVKDIEIKESEYDAGRKPRIHKVNDSEFAIAKIKNNIETLEVMDLTDDSVSIQVVLSENYRVKSITSFEYKLTSQKLYKIYALSSDGKTKLSTYLVVDSRGKVIKRTDDAGNMKNDVSLSEIYAFDYRDQECLIDLYSTHNKIEYLIRYGK